MAQDRVQLGLYDSSDEPSGFSKKSRQLNQSVQYLSFSQQWL
jgi:hypothetical protein